MSPIKKFKSLTLFLIPTIILLWFIFHIVSYLFAVSGSKNSQVLNPLFQDQNKEWFNVSQYLKKEDLENRVILLDFWSFTCINCLKNIKKFHELEEKFGDKLLIIGVHSGRLDNEKRPQSVKEAIIKYGINHPVINDHDLEIWDKFDILSWPSLILIDPKGKIEYQKEGNFDLDIVSKKITKLIKKHKFILNSEPLPIVLEKNKIASHVLNFPSKIEYASKFKYRRKRIPALIISNSLDNNILITNLDGRIIEKIGSKKAGFKDGDFRDVAFNYPTGLLYKDDILYVADRGNNAIRKVNFVDKEVTTIIGSGVSGGVLNHEIDAKNFHLSSPQDLVFFPDDNHLAIANLGGHQILIYDIAEKTLKPFAGDGNRELIDGKYPNNSLAQPSGLDVRNDKLYFVDAYSSSLRYADKLGNVRTLIGKGIDEFGNKNGDKIQALMQNPKGLFAGKYGVYVADSYNHLVRKYDYKSKKMTNYSGNGIKSDNIGTVTSYSEVSDLVLAKNKFYILDSHNNRVIVKNIVNNKTSMLDILPRLRLPQDGLLQYLPNLEIVPNKIVESSQNIDLIFKLSDGWKINETAPSFFNLVEINKKKQAELIASYDWNMINGGILKLPKMLEDNKYYLQGTIYYCEDKKNALCFLHSYEAEIFPKEDSQIKQISIEL